MSWPPSWNGPQFKRGKTVARAELKETKRDREKHEIEQKQKVRDRDGWCRFPLCGCRQRRRPVHVAHRDHKGMGGNPKGDRSDSDRMLLLCVDRHLNSKFSWHHGTVRWEPLDPLRGADGPVRWLIHLGDRTLVVDEVDAGILGELDTDQRSILTKLARLEE